MRELSNLNCAISMEVVALVKSRTRLPELRMDSRVNVSIQMVSDEPRANSHLTT